MKHFLLYYYYGGMIYTAVKNYDRAQYFFRVCITTPALAVSHIMLEAFKKYILVSLILEGRVCYFDFVIVVGVPFFGGYDELTVEIPERELLKNVCDSVRVWQVKQVCFRFCIGMC